MVAAATTSLPERAEAGRNYDYRYVWIRDQCYAGQAAAAAGATTLLDDAARFVTARILDHGPDLKPAYTTQGEAVPDQRSLDLPGYPGGNNLIGNWANQQFQLDAFGESLLLLAAAGRADRLDTDHWKAAEQAADAIATRWTEPDAGIWEIDNQPWTHSRLTCAAGLRAIARLPHAGTAAGDWLALADRIVADTAANCGTPQRAVATLPAGPRAGCCAAAAVAARWDSRRRPPQHRHPRRVPDRPHPRRVLPTGSGTTTDRWPTPKGPSPSAGSSSPSPCTNNTARWKRPAGTNAPGPAPDHPSCTPKSSTSTSTNSAGTSRRLSCTPCTCRPRSSWQGTTGRNDSRVQGRVGATNPGNEDITGGRRVVPRTLERRLS